MTTRTDRPDQVPPPLPAGTAPQGDDDGRDALPPRPSPPVDPRARKIGRVSLRLAVAWLALVVAVAALADVLPLHDYATNAGRGSRLAPHLGFPEPLGTDHLGRSVLSRLAYGARQSLLIGVVTVVFVMVLGLAIGSVAGYFRGKVDAAITVVLDAVLSLPGLVLLIAVASVGKRDIVTLVASLTLVGTPTFARLARANTLALVEREHVAAARVMGATHWRIISRELVPEVAIRLSSLAFLFLAVIIVLEGSLSFLGVGIPPPTPSWGGMINDARPYLEREPHLVFVPAGCLLLTVLSLTVIGDRARRHFDIRQSGLG